MDAPITYGSVCSGIEGASVAWAPLGWRCAFMAEIEPFPRAVLKHHYPTTPLFGDFTHLRDHHRETLVDVDVLVGGTPCQGFSVAGLRGSLSDDRSNLCLEFLRLANTIDDLRRAAGRPPCWILWENVPGVFSTDDNAFGAFMGGLVGNDSALDPGPRGRWTDAGVVAGPDRVAAWRVLDAQHFGLAQRRRRVFVLALGGAGAWRCADALLPLGDSLQGYPAPRRQARQRAAPTISARTSAGGDTALDVAGTMQSRGNQTGGDRGPGMDADTAATYLVPVTDTAPALTAAGGTERKHGQGWGQQDYEQPGFLQVGFGGNNTSGPIDIATAARAKGGTGHGDFESETFVVAHALNGRAQASHREDSDTYVAHSLDAHSAGGATEDGTGRGVPLIAHTLTADGFDASEDGSGRGSPLIAFNWQNGGGYGEAHEGLGITEDGVGPLDASTVKAVAIPADDVVAIQERAVCENPDAGPDGVGVRSDGVAYTLESRQVPQAVAFAVRGREGGAQAEAHEAVSALRSASGGSSRDFIAFDTTQLTHAANRSNPKPGDPCHPLAAGAHAPAVAFSVKDDGGDAAEDMSPTLRAGSFDKSHANAGVMPAVAYGIRSDASREGEAKTPSADAEGRMRLRDPGLGIYDELAPTVDASQPHAVAFNITPSQSNKDFNARPSDRTQALTPNGNRVSARGGDVIQTEAFDLRNGATGETAMSLQSGGMGDERGVCPNALPHTLAGSAVRRLTPTECSRLQGFPDGYLDIDFRGKPAADGPKYKALGNAFAVPVISWIGERIASVIHHSTEEGWSP